LLLTGSDTCCIQKLSAKKRELTVGAFKLTRTAPTALLTDTLVLVVFGLNFIKVTGSFGRGF